VLNHDLGQDHFPKNFHKPNKVHKKSLTEQRSAKINTLPTHTVFIRVPNECQNSAGSNKVVTFPPDSTRLLDFEVDFRDHYTSQTNGFSLTTI